jgi:hypothetical protein
VNLSDTEQKLYDYIKEKGQVTYKDIQKDLGDKYLGASGKLIQKELLEKSKKRQEISSFPGHKLVKILKVKEAK